MNSSREQQHFGLNHRVVAHADRIDQQPAKSRPVEYGFDHDRAAQQKAELQAHHRHDRD